MYTTFVLWGTPFIINQLSFMDWGKDGLGNVEE